MAGTLSVVRNADGYSLVFRYFERNADGSDAEFGIGGGCIEVVVERAEVTDRPFAFKLGPFVLGSVSIAIEHGFLMELADAI